MMNDFYENFFSFAAMLGSAPHGGVLAMGDSIAAASGQPYAGENYAIFGVGARPCDVRAILDFFRARSADFVAPILPLTPNDIVRALEANGIVHRCTYTAMSLQIHARGTCVKSHKKSNEFKEISARRISNADAQRWGVSVWLAFGGTMCDEARSYSEYAAFLASHEKNDAFALEGDARYLSTALIHKTKRTAGLYYFATLPEWRRHGFAARLMDAVTAEYADMPFVLLATEEGLPFYLAYGFDALAKIPIYSASDDI